MDCSIIYFMIELTQRGDCLTEHGTYVLKLNRSNELWYCLINII